MVYCDNIYGEHATSIKDAIFAVHKVTGFQARSRGGRWSWTLSPQVSSDEIMSREVELDCEIWTFFSLRVVPQQQYNGHCPCDSAQHGS